MSATLEQRIATALADSDIHASALATLVAETEAAVTDADQEAITAREQALDPITSPDPTKARAAMESAAFTRDRLRTVLPRLQERFEQVCLDEEYAAWRPQYEAIKAERDAANAKFKIAFTTFVADIIPQMVHLERIDAEASRVSAAKPRDAREAANDGRWLAGGPDDVVINIIRTIMQNLKLPDPEKPDALVWPPYRGINVTSVVPIFQNPGADWWQVKQAENARRRADDEKRAAALREEEGRVRNDPKLWRRG
jgi:hypothetical protein